MTGCPECGGVGGSWGPGVEAGEVPGGAEAGGAGWVVCWACFGLGSPVWGVLPGGVDPDGSFGERCGLLRRAVVDRLVDPDRVLEGGEWAVLESFVGDAELLWEGSAERVRVVRLLVARLSEALFELASLRLGVRRHRELVEDLGPGAVRREDRGLWGLVDREGLEDGDGDGL